MYFFCLPKMFAPNHKQHCKLSKNSTLNAGHCTNFHYVANLPCLCGGRVVYNSLSPDCVRRFFVAKKVGYNIFCHTVTGNCQLATSVGMSNEELRSRLARQTNMQIKVALFCCFLISYIFYRTE